MKLFHTAALAGAAALAVAIGAGALLPAHAAKMKNATMFEKSMPLHTSVRMRVSAFGDTSCRRAASVLSPWRISSSTSSEVCQKKR